MALLLSYAFLPGGRSSLLRLMQVTFSLFGLKRAGDGGVIVRGIFRDSVAGCAQGRLLSGFDIFPAD